MKNFIDEMKEKGLVAQIAHEDEFYGSLKEGKMCAYVGFDPTADSLHVGHLMPIMMLARWQRYGNRAIVLVGGGTAMIGDPSGRTELRKMLSREDINKNVEGLKKQFGRILNLEDSNLGIMVNNADWIEQIQYIPFLREVGSCFSVNKMLTAECFKKRLEHGLSFIEFNYMLLQAYDFLHLYKEYGCSVELGGDDQWSNMLAGVDLVRRKTSAKAYCMTSPLLTTSSGQKMGKTASGAVWLDPNKTSPYEYYQYWRNIPDELVRVCLSQFTFLPVEEIQRLAALREQEINEAKKVLAYETTKILHGEEEAQKAQKSASSLFGTTDSGMDSVPEFSVDVSDMDLVSNMIKAGIVASRSEARRLIDQGGVSINGVKVESLGYLLKVEDFKDGVALIRKGKKYYHRFCLKNG